MPNSKSFENLRVVINPVFLVQVFIFFSMSPQSNMYHLLVHNMVLNFGEEWNSTMGVNVWWISLCKSDTRLLQNLPCILLQSTTFFQIYKAELQGDKQRIKEFKGKCKQEYKNT